MTTATPLARILTWGAAAVLLGACNPSAPPADPYDHAVVTRALGHKHRVAFYAIDGTLAPGEGARRAIVESAYGVDKGSARGSVESASLSIAFDPQRVPFPAVQRTLERKLAAKKLSLLPLRVMDQPAELRVVGRQK